MADAVTRSNTSQARQLAIAALLALGKQDRLAMGMLRVALVIVLVWIGGLKFFSYEADSIVPLVANSPILRSFYQHPAEYRPHMNKEGELNLEHRAWHKENGTYAFSNGLGMAIVGLGVLIAFYPVSPTVSGVGSALLILMCCTTLSFLITTPEAWVAALGDANHGFPYLSSVGRLVVKDFIMLGAAMVTLADSAKAALARMTGRRSVALSQ